MKAYALAAALAAACLAFASPAAAEDTGGVRFSISPYLWLPTVEGDLRFSVPRSGQEFFPNVHVGPNDYLENLEGVLMIAGEVRYNRFSAFTDFIYLDFSRESATVISIDSALPIPPIDIGSTAQLSGNLWTLAGGYDLIDDETWRLQAFAGFRYLHSEVEVNWNLAGPLGIFPSTGGVGRESDSWDGLIGVRGEARLDAWFFPYYADVGAGDSDLTWQGSVGVGYRWGWGDVRLDYRYLSYEQDDALIEDLTLGGPALGATFRF